MFTDELMEVLNMIPYKVWEEVIDCNVDKVDVEKKYRFGGGDDTRPQIVVYIKSGIDTYVLEGLDSIDQRNEKLLCSWKPYHDLIKNEIEEYSGILQKTASYLPFEYSDKEIDIRFDQMCEDDNKPHTQLKVYIRWLHLKPILKKKCFCKDYPVSEKDIMDTAFEIIFEMVKEGLTGKTSDDILSDCEIEFTDATIEMLDDLIMYCRSVLYETWKDDQLRTVLRKFLSQRRDVKNLFDEAEEILEDAMTDLNEKEREYCRILGIDVGLKKDVISLNDKLLDGWTVGGNYFARGYLQGRFYSILDLLYDVYFKYYSDGKEVPLMLKVNPESKIIWEAVKASAKDYQEYPIIEFEDIEKEIEIKETSIVGGEVKYTCNFPKYNIYVKGNSIEELRKKIKREFEWNQEEMRVKKCLSLDE